MKKKFIMVLIAVMVFGAFSITAQAAAEREPERPQIKVASNVQIPLRIFFEGRQIKGYEYEVYSEALNRAGYDTYVVDVAFAGIFAGLQANKWDIAASNIFITKARAEEMDYSDPYLEANDVIIIRDDDDRISSLEDLRGKVVGTEVGTTQAAYAAQLQAQYGPFEIRGFEDVETQFMDLEAGRIDALTLGHATAVVYIQERGMFEVLAHSDADFMIGSFFRKGDPLRDEFNAALNEMKADGTVAALYEKYFGYAPPEGSAPVKVWEEQYYPVN